MRLPPDPAPLHHRHMPRAHATCCAHAAVCTLCASHARAMHVRRGMRCRRRLELEADDVLLLLPAGLRPVKDVLFGARALTLTLTLTLPLPLPLPLTQPYP